MRGDCMIQMTEDGAWTWVGTVEGGEKQMGFGYTHILEIVP